MRSSAKWVRRDREAGAAALEDRSSAPHSHPRRTSRELEHAICAVRLGEGFGPHRIAWALHIARSTVYAVLRRAGLNRLVTCTASPDRSCATSTPAPGDLLHLDVKKLGRIPDSGGKRFAPRYRSNAGRLHQLPRRLYRYSQRRPHGGIGGAVSVSRL